MAAVQRLGLADAPASARRMPIESQHRVAPPVTLVHRRRLRSAAQTEAVPRLEVASGTRCGGSRPERRATATPCAPSSVLPRESASMASEYACAADIRGKPLELPSKLLGWPSGFPPSTGNPARRAARRRGTERQGSKRADFSAGIDLYPPNASSRARAMGLADGLPR